jgi:hypothetical protein
MIVVFITTRDEADLLKDWIAYYLAYGVDHIVVADNKSKDHTQDIIRSFGDAVTSVVYADFNDSHKIMTRCLSDFKERYGTPDWLTMLDTDEFMWSRQGNLVEILAEVPPDDPSVMFKQKLFAVTACDGPTGPVFHRQLWRLVPESPLFFSYRRGKSFFRGAGFEYFFSSHSHPAIPRRCEWPEPVIHHYPIRSEDQFIQKVLYLSEEKVRPRRGNKYGVDRIRRLLGLHPRRRNEHKLHWFDILREAGVEGLRRHYRDQVLISREQVDQLAAGGEIIRDTQFADWMNKHGF